MSEKAVAADLLKSARAAAGMPQRELARKARTAQSVVARIELGEVSPSLETLGRLLRAAGFHIRVRLERIGSLERLALDDVPRSRSDNARPGAVLLRAEKHGVDLSSLREGLRDSPGERLERLDQNAAFIGEMREGVRAAKSRPSRVRNRKPVTRK